MSRKWPERKTIYAQVHGLALYMYRDSQLEVVVVRNVKKEAELL